MADRQVGNELGVASPGGTAQNGGASEVAGLTDADQATVDAMRTRLAAINGAYYTATRLNQMTVNDMRYAIRQNDEAVPAGTRI